MCAQPAKRLSNVHHYIFSEVDAAIARERQRGVNVLDLAKSDPSTPPERSVPAGLCDHAHLPTAHLYPPYAGIAELRGTFAQWYSAHYDAPCSPEHVHILSGSKGGLAHLPLAWIDPGDPALVPDPSYPTYAAGVALAGGEVVPLPLTEDNDYLPDYAQVDAKKARQARLLYLNYPHNPTGAMATDQFLQDTADFVRQNDLIACYDLAYARIVHAGRNPALGLRSIPAAEPRTIEFFTFSKTYSMQGYRLAAAVAAPDLLEPFGLVEENVSAGVFSAIQQAGIAALDPHTDSFVQQAAAAYRRRQQQLYETLKYLGGRLGLPDATVYLWMRAPRGLKGDQFAHELLHRAGIAVTPGAAFGEEGKHFVRIALTGDDRTITQACQRLRNCYPNGLGRVAASIPSARN